MLIQVSGSVSRFLTPFYNSFVIFADPPAATAKRLVRLLPFAQVPKMDFNSPIFHKAMTVVAKQTQAPVATSISPPLTPTVDSSSDSLSAAFVDRVFPLHKGTFENFYCFNMF